MSVAVLTQHNDAARSGVNDSEIVLDWSNVNVASFGKLCFHRTTGHVYAQPLYVPNVDIPGRGLKKLLIVATMANSVHAFDAEDTTGSDSALLWKTDLGPPVPTRAFKPGYRDISGAKAATIGILSTPVVDAVIADGRPTTGTVYVVAYTFEEANFATAPDRAFSYLLHALDLSTGRHVERAGLPRNPVPFEGEARAGIERGHLRLVSAPHVFQAGSIFHTASVNVSSFVSTFVVRLTQSDADGFTFTIQGQSPHALGGSGMGVGYGPDSLSAFDRGTSIGKSVALKFGLISPEQTPVSSLELLRDGVVPTSRGSDLNVDFHAGAPIRVTLEYQASRLSVVLEELVRGRPANDAARRDQRTFDIDIGAAVGSVPFVGFTAATGSKSATIDILSWTFETAAAVA